MNRGFASTIGCIACLTSLLTGCFDAGFVGAIFDELGSVKVQRRQACGATPCPTPTPSLALLNRISASASPSLRTGPAIVIGTVREATSLEPLESVFVQIEDRYVLTDKTGFFRIEQLESGPTKMSVAKDGFQSYSETLTLNPLKQVHDVLLKRLGSVHVHKQTTQIETTTTVTQTGQTP